MNFLEKDELYLTVKDIFIYNFFYKCRKHEIYGKSEELDEDFYELFGQYPLFYYNPFYPQYISSFYYFAETFWSLKFRLYKNDNINQQFENIILNKILIDVETELSYLFVNYVGGILSYKKLKESQRRYLKKYAVVDRLSLFQFNIEKFLIENPYLQIKKKKYYRFIILLTFVALSAICLFFLSS